MGENKWMVMVCQKLCRPLGFKVTRSENPQIVAHTSQLMSRILPNFDQTAVSFVLFRMKIATDKIDGNRISLFCEFSESDACNNGDSVQEKN